MYKLVQLEDLHVYNPHPHGVAAPSLQRPRCYLLGLEPRWNPGVLLGGAARVVIGDGVSLEVRHQPCHNLFQLARHRVHGVLLAQTLAVHADLPEGQTSGLAFAAASMESEDGLCQALARIRHLRICSQQLQATNDSE